MANGKCPWCEPRMQQDGRPVFMRLVHAPLFQIENIWEPCGHCGATGTASAWQEHPEYLRQRFDRRLHAYRIEWP